MKTESAYTPLWKRRKFTMMATLLAAAALLGVAFHRHAGQDTRPGLLFTEASGMVAALLSLVIVSILLFREIRLWRTLRRVLMQRRTRENGDIGMSPKRWSEKSYRLILMEAPDAMLISDVEGNILETNDSAAKLFGLPANELTRRKLHNLYENGVRVERPFRYREVRRDTVLRSERTILGPDATAVPVEEAARQLSDGRLLIVLRDIRQQKKAGREMRLAIERYDLLAEATSDTIWDWDLRSNSKVYNAGITKMFGYDNREVKDAHRWLDEKLHPDDAPLVRDSFRHVIEQRLQHMQLEYRFRCADGSYKHIYDRSFVIYGERGIPVRIIGAMQDISQTREEERRLARAILEAQEKERQHIGWELHDNVNQLLACAQMNLNFASDYFPDAERVPVLIDSGRKCIQDAIVEIRKLSHELAPAISGEESLLDIFLDLLNRINVEKKYVIRFDCDDALSGLVPENVLIMLYRILQEQLKNIESYAHAKQIAVGLSLSDGNLHFRIEDDGRGFDVRTARKGIGLNNIRKRVESLGGKFRLLSAPGKGCTIQAEIPVG